MAVRSERIEFTGHDGRSALAARLDTPAGRPRAVALFAHCFTCSKDIHAASRIAGALTGRGIAVLRFDFTGLGASEGEFANTDFTSNVQDLIAAARYLEGRGMGPAILVGHSLGGAAVLAAAGDIPSVRAVATIGAPADPAHVAHLLAGKAGEIREKGAATVAIAGRSFTISRRFLEDISGHNLENNLRELKRALLVFHAPRDNIVGIDNAAAIFAAARHPKSFVSLDDADHLLSRHADAVYVADVLAAWAGRYIGGEEAQANEAPAVPEGFDVVVRESGAGPLAQEIRAGGHGLTADEPENAGGTDTGPTPYGLLLAALGACTSMTLRLYAARKGWEIGPIAVALRHGKIHAEDCANCETKEGRIDRIERVIGIAGTADPEQHARLLEIADKCPVHRTLTGEVDIRTHLEN